MLSSVLAFSIISSLIFSFKNLAGSLVTSFNFLSVFSFLSAKFLLSPATASASSCGNCPLSTKLNMASSVCVDSALADDCDIIASNESLSDVNKIVIVPSSEVIIVAVSEGLSPLPLESIISNISSCDISSPSKFTIFLAFLTLFLCSSKPFLSPKNSSDFVFSHPKSFSASFALSAFLLPLFTAINVLESNPFETPSILGKSPFFKPPALVLLFCCFPNPVFPYFSIISLVNSSSDKSGFSRIKSATFPLIISLYIEPGLPGAAPVTNPLSMWVCCDFSFSVVSVSAGFCG